MLDVLVIAATPVEFSPDWPISSRSGGLAGNVTSLNRELALGSSRKGECGGRRTIGNRACAADDLVLRLCDHVHRIDLFSSLG